MRGKEVIASDNYSDQLDKEKPKNVICVFEIKFVFYSPFLASQTLFTINIGQKCRYCTAYILPQQWVK